MENVDITALKDNEYMLFYEMMVQALRTDNVEDGINSSLYLLKEYLNSGNVILYKKGNDGAYSHDLSDSSMAMSVAPVTCIVNKTSPITEKRGVFKLYLDLSKSFKNMVLTHLITDDNEYILSINNPDEKKELDSDFWNRLKEAMQITLKRAESYEKNMKAVSMDLLTGLGNRNSYELETTNLPKDTNLVYGLFDLFRLKYVNDNYSHDVGDIYIIETAKILDKYWPKYQTEVVNGEIKQVSSGHNVYRIGGDEFVLITNEESLELATIKANLAAEEVSMIDLGIEDELPLGLNLGLTFYDPNKTIKEAYRNADEIMQEDKRKMYVKHGLERRRR